MNDSIQLVKEEDDLRASSDHSSRTIKILESLDETKIIDEAEE